MDADRLADRLGIGHIVLVALHIGFHVVGRHEAHLMAKRGQLASPMVRRRAGFEADQARRNPGKEREDLAASQPLDRDLTLPVSSTAMNLENTLCQIQDQLL